jgi:hypothetical protein
MPDGDLSSPDPAPTAPARGPFRRRALSGAVVLVLALTGTALAAEPASTLGRVAAAWVAESAEGVLAQVPDEGVLTVRLLQPAVSAPFLKPQALQTLKAYFLKIEGAALRDVTPEDHRDAPGLAVRTYDYTYRPIGRDPVTTRLEITLKAAAEGRWELVSVMERPRPAR